MNPTLTERPDIDLIDVKWRVDSEPKPDRDGGGHSARFVAYVTADQCADLLDRWVGPMHWAPSYSVNEEQGAVWCSVLVNHPDHGHPVAKVDVGDLNSDDMKSSISDAFKRTVTRAWGLGRSIRELPPVWAPVDTYVATRNGKDVLVAVPTRATKTTLRRKLANLGYGGVGDTVDGDTTEPDDELPAEPAPPPAPDTPVGRPHGVAEVAELWEALRPIGAAAQAWEAWKQNNGRDWASSESKVESAFDFMSALADQYLDQPHGERS